MLFFIIAIPIAYVLRSVAGAVIMAYLQSGMTEEQLNKSSLLSMFCLLYIMFHVGLYASITMSAALAIKQYLL